MPIYALALAAMAPASNDVIVPELCQFVAENISETEASVGTKFVYQTRMYRAAGASSMGAPGAGTTNCAICVSVSVMIPRERRAYAVRCTPR